VSTHGKIGTITHRFAKLGLRYPDEQSIRWAVAVIALAVSESTGLYPEYSVVYRTVQDFKKAMDVARTPYDHGHLLKYPASPHSLNTDMFNAAYSDDDLPITKNIEKLANTAEHHVPLRSSSALLKREQGRGNGSSSSADAVCGAGGVTWDQLRMFMHGGQPPVRLTMTPPTRRQSSVCSVDSPPAMISDGALGGVSEPSTSLALCPPTGRRFLPSTTVGGLDAGHVWTPVGPPVDAALPPPLADVETSTSPLPVAATKVDAGHKPGLSAELYEEAALKALLARDDAKKAAKAVKKSEGKSTAAKPVGKGKAAAKTPSVTAPAVAMKRPAAALIEDVVKWDTDSPSRRAFVSKMYHRVKKLAEGKSLPDPDVVAQAAHKKAGGLWDKYSKI